MHSTLIIPNNILPALTFIYVNVTAKHNVKVMAQDRIRNGLTFDKAQSSNDTSKKK